MHVLWYIIVFCVGSWGVVSLIFVPQAGTEIFLGMIAPLLLASGTIMLVERTYRKQPKRLTSLMTKAFIGKMLLYGIYVSLVVGFFSVGEIPFAISFTVYFTGLHLAEALYFRTLFTAQGDEGRSR